MVTRRWITRRWKGRSVLVGLACVAGLLAPAADAVGASPAGATGRSTSGSPPASVPVSPSRGCTAVPVPGPGTALLPFDAAGEPGTYTRQIPTGYDGRTPMPLVMDFHGWSEPAPFQVTLSGLGTLGQQDGFITVTPDITRKVEHWNTGLGSADMTWIGRLMDTLESTLCLDQHRIYAAGYSDGAFLVSAMACRLSDRVAAVAPVAGITDVEPCHASRPVPVVAFHGTKDPFVSYNGGLGAKALDLPAANGSGRTLGQTGGTKALRKGRSIPAMTAGWARRNGCRRLPSSLRVAADVTLFRYRCPNNASVELYRVKGGGHAWPGSEVSRSLASVVGRTTMSISATDIMWDFFRHHPLTASD